MSIGFPTFECALECILAAVQSALASAEWPGPTLWSNTYLQNQTTSLWIISPTQIQVHIKIVQKPYSCFFLVRMWHREIKGSIKCSRPIFSGSKLWRLVWFVRSVFYNRNHQTLWSPGACVPSLIHRHVASVNWQLTGGVTSTISVTSELYLSSEILYHID